MSSLEERQEALVLALVAGGPLPSGFDTEAVAVTSAALIRKRAGEVAHHLPMVRHTLGDRYLGLFTAWATGRPKTSSYADAQAFAAHIRALKIGELTRRTWYQRLLRK
ncbi:hypothetical protein [Rhodococcus sp. IEGM 1379]|uniref:hypothetical protein n=1 Tax=Rhodococcus sp. IEGM 1379 TaxID=3047086 RepID=UPI0024B7D8B8|nr:hypothetical protein [Rhodococcus sp. IEGM 1379]MDI9915974.1 hypothetical protein [Rhodococcus sp. IEGM 1379]